MSLDRRLLLGASLGLGAAATGLHAAESRASSRRVAANAADFAPGLTPDLGNDQSERLQSAIDRAAENNRPLVLPPGKFIVSDIFLRPSTRLIGAARTTVLMFGGGPALLTADGANSLVLDGLTLDGGHKPFDGARGDALLALSGCQGIRLTDLDIRNSAGTGLSLVACSGRIESVTIAEAHNAGMKCLDSTGLSVTGNTVTDCANNGILIWRTTPDEDGSLVIGNRVSRIRNAAGGTGEYGNGINIFRAGSVLVANNRITDCAYSAVRGNAASNIQIIANSCERLGEVALYAEFGFEGAIIANNLVDSAATGISVTNFAEGGRLAVIQGNLIRNLFRREQEPEDKRGEGIGVEADAVVIGNTIENAPTVGIQIGWGRYLRDVTATGNVIRHAPVGISVAGAKAAGKCLIANNLISAAKHGAIREMQFGEMLGPDLVGEIPAGERIHLIGNIAV